MRHWPRKCSVCIFLESGHSFPVWQQWCHFFTVGLIHAKKCRYTTHATSTSVLIWECGHTKKLLQAKQGHDLYHLHLYLYVCVLPPGTDSVLGSMSPCPLLQGAACSQGVGRPRNALGMAKKTQLELLVQPTLWRVVYTKRFAPGSPQEAAAEARLELFSSLNHQATL